MPWCIWWASKGTTQRNQLHRGSFFPKLLLWNCPRGCFVEMLQRQVASQNCPLHMRWLANSFWTSILYHCWRWFLTFQTLLILNFVTWDGYTITSWTSIFIPFEMILDLSNFRKFDICHMGSERGQASRCCNIQNFKLVPLLRMILHIQIFRISDLCHVGLGEESK